jgi:saccharopine dehydrogenase-like NADP-dependent oxidoreductase
MRALVLGGAGAVAKETTRDLSAFSTFDEIVVADYDVAAAEAIVKPLGDSRITVIGFDANDPGKMRDLFPGFDVVVNGLPFKYDLIVNQVCVETGVSGLDLSSEDAQFAMHEEAKGKDMIFIPGVGATPGITNALSALGVSKLDAVESIQIYFAAFRCLAPAPGLLATTIWEFDPDEPAREEVYFQDGKWLPAPPLTGERRVRFHSQIGEQPVYFVPHDEAFSLPASYPGLKHASVRGCFPPHVMNMMRTFKEAGMLGTEPLDALGGRAPVEMVRELLLALPWSKENPVWAYGLVIEVEGEKDGQRTRLTYRTDHPPQDEWGGASAYYKNVGIPLAIGAQLIAEGAVTARGVLPPEVALPTGRFLEEIARRGITYEETVEAP